MPALVVVDTGVCSIQGLGRYGSQRYGIAPGGAMDRMGLAQANALTGAPAGAAAIEIGPLPVRILVSGGPVCISISGADRDVFVDDRPLPLGVTHVARDKEFISLRGVRGGQYSYLSVQGGLLGVDHDAGRATQNSSANAANSWTFRCGDRVSVEQALAEQPEYRMRLRYRKGVPIRVVLGPQLEFFSPDAVHAFLSTTWTVTHAANRMAYVLGGPPLALERGCDIVSDGIVTGSIQVAGSGQPIAMLRDRGTVGGYPKIATIISADIGWFAQTPLSGQVTFEAVSVVEAQVVARDFAFELANLKPKLEEYVSSPHISAADLFQNNVAGDAFSPSDWLQGPPSGSVVPVRDFF